MGKNVKRWVRLLKRRDNLPLYKRYLLKALGRGYKISGLEEWFFDRSSYIDKDVLILRHDVDMRPISALHMAYIEHSLGVTSTYYFRWHTFDLKIIRKIQKLGFQVGLHYETLSRFIQISTNGKGGPRHAITEEMLKKCREELKVEISYFREHVGPVRSIAAHGAPILCKYLISNNIILRGRSNADLGIVFEAYDETIKQGIDCWIADSPHIPAYWSRGIPPDIALEKGYNKILWNFHPHHWEAGWRYIWESELQRIRSINKPYFYRADPTALAWLNYQKILLKR